MTKALVEANKRIREHFSAARNEDGMEAAQVILILIFVVIIIIPVVRLVANALASKASDAESAIDNSTN